MMTFFVTFACKCSFLVDIIITISNVPKGHLAHWSLLPELLLQQFINEKVY